VDAVLLSRIQFAITVGFHFIYPPLTIGLAWIIVYLMIRRLRTGSKSDEAAARFWVKIFALSFAVGVASGITMEFQFGTNWANYSRFVGDIFGAPLAAEAILSFFLESTFLAVLLLGWNRVSPKVHLFSAIMVAVGATLSAFWILVANSWQQTPAGYHLVNNRAELTSFFEAVFNPSTLPRFAHTLCAAFITAGFFVMGIGALYLLKKRHEEFARRSLMIGLVVALISSFLELPLGHLHAVQVARTQPAKLAAVEGLYTTQKQAPAIVIGLISGDPPEAKYALKVKGLLSLLVHGNINKEIKGLDAFPKDEWPPVALTFYSFHAMVILGMYFIGLTALGALLWWRQKLFSNRLFLWLATLSIPLPFIANELGWITAEVGRQPWVVYELLRTKDAISVMVPASQILLTIVLFCMVYALLFAVWIGVLRREFAKGPQVSEVKSKEDLAQ